MYNAKELKNICESILSTYQEDYIIKYSNINLEKLLEDFSRDVKIFYDIRFDTDLKNINDDIGLHAIITPYKKRLKKFVNASVKDDTT